MGPLGDSESEKQTRKQRVDPRLRASGWRVVPFETLRPLSARDREAVEEYPTGAGPSMNRSRQVAQFHTPAALDEALGRELDGEIRKLRALPNDHRLLRPYQIDANTAIEQAIAERKRQMLVAMATDTGKTFTIVNQVYRLMKSGVARRILFLVDRRVLVAQAVRGFASFDAVKERPVRAASLAEKLIEAVLGKAFRGELVPTEAELARRDGREYEPAAALLAKAGVDSGN